MNTATERPDVSVVVPTFNECDSVARLHKELSEVAATLDRSFEFFFVDDGSNDGTWEALTSLQAADSRIGLIRLRRNFGKSAALAAGFGAARADIVMTLDADLQDDPREIPHFLARLSTGADLVSGWKKTRLDPWHKTLPSRLFNLVVSAATGVHLHDHNCGFKAYRRQVLAEIPLYGELYRYIPVMAAARGFQVAEVAVRHRPRQFGSSKYGWRRFTRGFLDLLTVKFLTSYHHRPQHLLGGGGLLATILGAFWLSWISARSALGTNAETSTPMVLGALALTMLGIHLMTVGLLAELIIARSMTQSPPYAIAEARMPVDKTVR